MDRDGENFLESVCEILKQSGVFGSSKDEVRVVHFEYPEALQSILNLSLEDSEGIEDDKLHEICKQVIDYSVKTSHRRFHNQLYGAVDNYALAGAWMSDALNTNQYTFEAAPAFSLMEQVTLKKAYELFGLPPDSDGILCPGGSMANMYAMVLARYKAFPNVKMEGTSCLPRLTVFTSEESHYSLQKGSHWLGIGTKNLVKIPTDCRGRMIPEQLKYELIRAKNEGATPIMVNATAGTTVLGSFDPFEEIADICKDHGVWMHVDACLGGSLRFSKKYGQVLKGIERADSISWNPHKTLGVPLQCSLFLCRHKTILYDSNSATAHYLFQQDKFYDVSFDTGDKSVQCGRKVDAFKLWLMWKARGNNGLKLLIDNAMDKAYYFKNKIADTPGFELVIEDNQCTNICFWYIPLVMRDQDRTEEWWTKLDTVAPKIKERMVLKGSMMLGYMPLKNKGLKNFFRMVVTCHPPSTCEDMNFVIDEIQRLAQEIDI